MPQVDIVSACAGGGSSDRKVVCDNKDDDDVQNPESVIPADFPPESFWLSKDAEFDWFDRNAFYERKESTKGISHSSSTHIHPSSTSASQRFNSKSSIIGLPKTQKTSYVDGKRRNGTKPANIRLLPKRPTTVGKQASTLTEPSSPKVSCMGRVRSKRRGRKSCDLGKSKDKSLERTRSSSSREKRKTGFGSKFMAMFRSGKSHKKPVQKESAAVEAPRKSLSSSKRGRENSGGNEPVGDAPGNPGLGGMKRFASGRRSTEENPLTEPLGLGAMKRFASGRKSTDEFDGVLTGLVNLDRVGPTGSK